MQATSHLQRSQSANAVANEAMEKVRSVAPQESVSGTSGIIIGRSKTTVDAAWASAASIDKADSIPVWDVAATAASVPLIPIVSPPQIRSGISYGVTTLIGRCFRSTSLTGASKSCVKVDPGSAVAIYRATVVVTWKPTSSGQCGGAVLCTYRMSALLDPNDDATWNLTAKPVAYDDADGEIFAATAAADFPVVTNDVIGPVAANPTTITTPANIGSGSALVTPVAKVGWIRYTPPVDKSGIATLKYKLRDGAGRVSNEAVVTIKVRPAAIPDTFSIPRGSTAVVDVLANDHGTFTGPAASVAPSGQPGYVSVAGTAVTVVAPAGGPSSASFTYIATDASGLASLPVSVTLTFTTAIPTGTPVAVDLTYRINAVPGTVSIPLSILSQPGMTSNDPTNVIAVLTGPTAESTWTQGNSGSLTGNGTSDLNYMPKIDRSGIYSFTYNVKDSAGASSNNAKVTLIVVPVVRNYSPNVKKSDSWTRDLSSNVVGGDSAMKYFITSGASSACGVATLDPSTGYFSFSASTTKGTCIVAYTVGRNGAVSDPGTITIKVVD